jgi:hypothetical protein
MRPFHHARASAAPFNRDWREDLEIHEFIDSSKVAYADLRHRMILHSVDFGAEIVARAFPTRSDAREVARRHVVEDIGEERRLADWLNLCRPNALPSLINFETFDLEAQLEAERSRQNLRDLDGPRHVWELLSLPCQYAPEAGISALGIMGNAFGVSLVRRIFGPPKDVAGANGRKIPFDAAWCAEGLIFRLYRSIPDLRSVATAVME